jgi:2-polyprenyl-3-methyl-5-hydroxy-6-metoxy-1,4-benzoquinol methylase
MFDTIDPFCKGNILEIGSGIGNISQFFIEAGKPITLSDSENFYVQTLKHRFPKTNVLAIDLNHADFFFQYKDLMGQFDTVFLLNVIEHIRDDRSAIRNCTYLLKDGGTLIVLTPAHPFLYSKIDKGLHHYRRYTRPALKELVSSNDLNLERLFYFNALGMAGWLIAKFSGDKKISPKKMKTYDRLVGFAKFLDKLFLNKTGLSIIAVAQKKPG